jgi:hypothetical protein
MLKNGSSWNLVPLLASSTKGGERGVPKAPGLDYGEGQLFSYSVLHQTNHKLVRSPSKTPLVLGQARATRTHLTHHGPDSGEATTFPHIVFSALLRRTRIQMTFIPGTPKEESRNCPDLDSQDFGSS